MGPGEKRRFRSWWLAAVVSLGAVSGCGGDGDDEDSLASIPQQAELRQYCEAWTTVEPAIEDPAAVPLPPEQLERLAELAPDDVSDDVEVVVAGLRQAQEGDTAAVESAAFEDARQRLVEYQAELETEGDAPCEPGVGDLDG